MIASKPIGIGVAVDPCEIVSEAAAIGDIKRIRALKGSVDLLPRQSTSSLKSFRSLLGWLGW